jgi:hypothetical protein
MPKEPPVVVTDHAVIRYLERVRGLDVEAIRAEIAAECSAAVAVGATRLRRGDLDYRIRGKSITTIVARSRS